MARPGPAKTERRTRRRGAAAGLTALLGLGLVAGACSHDPERSVAAYCAQVKNVQSLDEVLHSGDVSRINGQLDQLRALQKVAPSEIEPKIAAIIPFIDDYSHTVGTTKEPDAALDEVIERRKNDAKTVTDAGIAVATYSFDNCQVTLGSGVPGTGTSVPGSAPSSTTTTTKPVAPVTTVPTTPVTTAKAPATTTTRAPVPTTLKPSSTTTTKH